MEKFTDWELLVKYLSNECSTNERKFVENWIKESKSNEQTFDELKTMWDKLKDNPSVSVNKKKAWENIDKRLDSKNQKSNPFQSKFLKYAAAILVLIACSYFFIQIKDKHKIENQIDSKLISITNNEDKSKMVVLPDSSKVWLNRSSSVTYKSDFEKDRNIELNGEAFFDVKKDLAHPFVIITGNTKTKVLGTSFNIKENKNQHVQLSVYSGKVEFGDINQDNSNCLLEKGEQAIFSDINKTISKAQIKDKNELSWKTEILIFENNSLDYVAQTLSNHYLKEIKVHGSKLSAMRFTSTFRNESLENVLDIIANTLSIKISKQEDYIIIQNK